MKKLHQYHNGDFFKLTLKNGNLICLIIDELRILVFEKEIEEIKPNTIFDISDIFGYFIISMDKDFLKKVKVEGNYNNLNSIIQILPPLFHQDRFNKNNCTLYYLDGSEQKAKPNDCIGLNSDGVWPSLLFEKMLEDYLANSINIHLERSYVKL